MDVILLEKIGKLGSLGDKVSVKAGFGRNFLIPQGKAVPATKKNLAEFEAKRQMLEEKAAKVLAQAQERTNKLQTLTLEIAAMASDEGKLYGSVGTRDIADIICAKGIDVKKSEIRLPHGALRYTGEYDIDIQLHTDVLITLKLNIVAEK